MSEQKTLDDWMSLARSANYAAKPQTLGPSTSRRDQGFRQREDLVNIAKETRTILPEILKKLPNIRASKSEALYLSTLPPLKPSECSMRTTAGFATIRIVNDDSLNAAIDLASLKGNSTSGRVAVLNMASHANPGGGWLKGARAQEEALCYRSSLALSLHRHYYPFKQRMGLYTPDVVVIRSDIASGHNLLVPDVEVQDLPVVSVLSIAALRCPETRQIQVNTAAGDVLEKLIYADPAARELTKDKMRLCLRMAAYQEHSLLVLGALGCGAFKNPNEEVAHCWLEVLQEAEFQGGRWEEIWFAVYDTRKEGNFEVFERVLGGAKV
ncbi:hypothetical protein QQS21_002441 [Conoideocrella luteorostrata]|uniref:Microbial-type PARG catalytic domain-containing protein n=1 Tax=Conoideocrella luteorostrata TaxID=1105319 RepID=A0AAJ0CV90_9HYPO|nr:hypothetical protein QQS21_002441 [Conoideocrella luteorostrata]